MDDILHPRFGYPITPWWRWFAWYPVDTTDRGWVWLRVVWRRRIAKYNQLQGGDDFWFQTAVAPATSPGPTETNGEG